MQTVVHFFLQILVRFTDDPKHNFLLIYARRTVVTGFTQRLQGYRFVRFSSPPALHIHTMRLLRRSAWFKANCLAWIALLKHWPLQRLNFCGWIGWWTDERSCSVDWRCWWSCKVVCVVVVKSCAVASSIVSRVFVREQFRCWIETIKRFSWSTEAL